MQRPCMVVHGLPAAPALSRSGAAQVAALNLHWRVQCAPAAAGGDTEASERISPLERLYREFDRRLFGRGKWAQKSDAAHAEERGGDATGLTPWHLAWHRSIRVAGGYDRLCVEYEGLPMAELEQAVRLRLGQPGGMLRVRVFLLRASQPPRLLVEGCLRLDHRSLWRSIVACALKLPALLRGAGVRRELPARATRRHEAPPPPAPLSALRQVWRLAYASVVWSLYREQWQLEVGNSRGDIRRPVSVSTVLRPPSSAFWADPFFLRRGARTWVVFEELPFDTNRGHIAAMEIDGSGHAIARPQVVLKEPWHLSYPFLWNEEGRDYMIPESGANRDLALYEFVGEGRQWRRRATLISGWRLADATVARHDGRLWMFATCGDDGAFMDDTLHVYWANRIEGPWHPHALNPVKVDASSSRPAGSMWVSDGFLHRVVQDCSSTYGGRVRCMRIVRLTPDEFEEEPVSGWSPPEFESSEPWHTFNSIGNLTVIDRLVRLPRWRR